MSWEADDWNERFRKYGVEGAIESIVGDHDVDHCIDCGKCITCSRCKDTQRLCDCPKEGGD